MNCPSCGETNPDGATSCETCQAALPAAKTGPTGPAGDLAPGTLIKGTYRVTRFLGEGGAGAVYIGEHIHLGNPVAIKALFGKFIRDAQMRRRFLEEAIIQANLNHPNIARVNDVVEEGTFCAIIMEYIDGSSLDRWLEKRTEPPAVEQAARMFLAILEGLSHAHAEGVVHRDIKPANILLANTADGMVPKVTDFGIAKVLSDHQRTETGTAMGTVYYAPPEQLTDAKSVDHRADIYSLGCTFYEMLTLQLPFQDSTMFGVMTKHLRAPRPDPRHLNDKIPAAVASAVMRAMAVDAEHRHQSCAELGAEIRAALSLTGVSGAVPMPAVLGASVPIGDRPIMQRTGSRTTGGGPVQGVPDAVLTGPPRTSTPLRAATPSRVTRPRSPQRPRRPRPNIVARAMWGVIGVLALGLAGIIVASMGDGEPTEPPAPVVDSRPAVGSGAADVAAPTPAADVEPASTDARLTIEDLTRCRELSARHAYFDPLGVTAIGDAVAEIDALQAPCAALMRAHAADGSTLDRVLAELNVFQTRLVGDHLRGLQSGNAPSAYCEHALGAVTAANQALRRIDQASGTEVYLSFEVQSLESRRDDLSAMYRHTLATFPGCRYAVIPDELLSEDPNPPAIEGSGAKPQ